MGVKIIFGLSYTQLSVWNCILAKGVTPNKNTYTEQGIAFDAECTLAYNGGIRSRNVVVLDVDNSIQYILLKIKLLFDG